MCTKEKSLTTFLSVLYIENTHTCLQISYKPVVQACHDFKILIHISKGEEINFKFYLFSLGLSGKIESNKRNFHNKFIRFSYLEQSTSCTNKTIGMYQWCTKELLVSVVRGQAFLILNEVIIFPQAQWKVRVRETDSDYVIWVNIQRRIKGKIIKLKLIKLSHLYCCFVHYANAN